MYDREVKDSKRKWVNDMKMSTYPVIFAVALVCISSLATALEPQVVDANSKISCLAL